MHIGVAQRPRAQTPESEGGHRRLVAPSARHSLQSRMPRIPGIANTGSWSRPPVSRARLRCPRRRRATAARGGRTPASLAGSSMHPHRCRTSAPSSPRRGLSAAYAISDTTVASRSPPAASMCARIASTCSIEARSGPDRRAPAVRARGRLRACRAPARAAPERARLTAPGQESLRHHRDHDVRPLAREQARRQRRALREHDRPNVSGKYLSSATSTSRRAARIGWAVPPRSASRSANRFPPRSCRTPDATRGT